MTTTDTQPHADRAHAGLGPSSAEQWMTCPGSKIIIPIFEEKHPPKRSGSRHSDMGTIAHEVCEALVLGNTPVRPGPLHEDDEPMSDDEWEEILGHALGFREYVRSFMDDGDLLLVEKRVYIRNIDPSGGMFGTADIIIFKRATGKLLVIDLKYGMRPVAVDDNKQLKLYLIGAAELMIEMGHKVTGYEGHIYQPRVAGGIGGCGYSMQEIYDFTTQVIAAVKRIADGDESRVPSDKGCQWCPVYGTEYCPESSLWVSKDILGLLDELEDLDELTVSAIAARDPEEFTVEQLAQMYLLFGAAKKWMAKVEGYLTPLANDGSIDGLKVVEGRGSNQVVDPEEIDFIVGDLAWKPRQIKSMTDLKKVVGAKNFPNLLGDCFKKLPGKPNLVASTDKRPAIANDADLLSELDDFED